MAFFVYMLASRRNGTLYVGHTDNLTVRTWQHRNKVRPGFTAKYEVLNLVWFSLHDTREGAKARERQLKHWNRAWKNPSHRDLQSDVERPV